MTTLTVKIFDIESGEEVIREMTAKELADYKAANADYFGATS